MNPTDRCATSDLYNNTGLREIEECDDNMVTMCIHPTTTRPQIDEIQRASKRHQSLYPIYTPAHQRAHNLSEILRANTVEHAMALTQACGWMHLRLVTRRMRTISTIASVGPVARDVPDAFNNVGCPELPAA